MNSNIDQVRSYFNNLQMEITSSLQAADGLTEFVTDDWVRETGGGGRTMVSQHSTLNSRLLAFNTQPSTLDS